MGTNKKTFGTRTDKTTGRAGLGSHIGIDLDNFNALSDCFIANKVLQLVETPSIKPEVHPLAEPLLSYKAVVFTWINSACNCNYIIMD